MKELLYIYIHKQPATIVIYFEYGVFDINGIKKNEHNTVSIQSVELLVIRAAASTRTIVKQEVETKASNFQKL